LSFDDEGLGSSTDVDLKSIGGIVGVWHEGPFWRFEEWRVQSLGYQQFGVTGGVR